MICINKDCPCGLYSETRSYNCLWHFNADIRECPSFKSKEPKKRLLTANELFERGATHIKDASNSPCTIHSFDYNDDCVTYGESFCKHKIDTFNAHDKWTSDRKTWHSFEVVE